MTIQIIGISGGVGSFSEQSANYYANKHDLKNIKLEYLISVENVLVELNKKTVDIGIFPIENSNGGIVYESIYAMSNHLFNIKEIFEIDIRHCLIVKPGTKAASIKTIISHDQALK